jgi:hypothetical protein
MQLRNLAVFASWESEEALDAFLTNTKLGNTLLGWWHLRLELIRRWGHFSEFDEPLENARGLGSSQPAVAVTLARLRLSQLTRFIRWGKPVEKLVRDHPGTTMALAAIRPPRTFSTFSVWRTLDEMTDMVHGKGSIPGADRHAEAMGERNRRDFHHKFTTLRFRCLSEHGKWEGQSDLVPK